MQQQHKTTLFGEKVSKNPLLRDILIVPPFSVFDTRLGYWRERKRRWIKLGIESELGRAEGSSTGGSPLPLDRCKAGMKNTWYSRKVSSGGSPRPACDYSKQERGDGRGRPLATCIGKVGENFGRKEMTGTSIFDPVLCELMYRWFCPKGGKIFDPFAGGSVRGIVANYLGYHYTGIDLSKKQLEANRKQSIKIVKKNEPKWIVGDGRDCNVLAKGKYDFIFSCPPYVNLEVYSDDPRDLSILDYADFLKAYIKIIRKSVKMLKKDRFACFVVGDVRDKKTGFYYDFVSATIKAFQIAGALLYNEVILITAIGSLPIRALKPFLHSRKIGRMHQYVLIFYKGNPKNIKIRRQGNEN